MSIDATVLDELQAKYKQAVETWIAAIRHEEALASAAEHSATDIDAWEDAGRLEDKQRNLAKHAKINYEDALRKEFFNF